MSDIPCNRFTFQRGPYCLLSERLKWIFWDHKYGYEADLYYDIKPRKFRSQCFVGTNDPAVTEALRNALPPEELARATALSITGGQSK